MKKTEWILTEQFTHQEDIQRKAAFEALLGQYLSQALLADCEYSGAFITSNQASYELEVF